MNKFKVGQRVWVGSQRYIGEITTIHDNLYLDVDNVFMCITDLHETADDMFEKLGYEKDNDIKNERIIYKWEDSLEIIFSLKEKEVWLERIGDTSGEYILEINEHLAIHQQLIELGEIE